MWGGPSARLEGAWIPVLEAALCLTEVVGAKL